MFDGFAATVTITEIAAITQVIANHCARDDEVAGDDSHANTQILMTLMTMMMRRMTVIATRYKKYKQHRRSSGASSSSSRWWRRRRKRNDNNKNVNSNQILEVIVVEVIIGTAGVVAVVAAVVAIVVVLVFFSGSSGGSRSGSGSSSSSSRNTRDLNSKELEITIVCLGHTLVSNGIIIHSRCTVLIAEAPVLTWETPRPGCTKHQVRCARTFQQPGNTKHPERSQT